MSEPGIMRNIDEAAARPAHRCSVVTRRAKLTEVRERVVASGRALRQQHVAPTPSSKLLATRPGQRSVPSCRSVIRNTVPGTTRPRRGGTSRKRPGPSALARPRCLERLRLLRSASMTSSFRRHARTELGSAGRLRRFSRRRLVHRLGDLVRRPPAASRTPARGSSGCPRPGVARAPASADFELLLDRQLLGVADLGRVLLHQLAGLVDQRVELVPGLDRLLAQLVLGLVLRRVVDRALDVATPTDRSMPRSGSCARRWWPCPWPRR